MKPEDRITNQETATKVSLDPDVPNNVEFVSWKSPGDRVLQLFEAGKVAVFDQVPPPVDLAILRKAKVNPDRDRRVKKAGVPALLAELTETTFPKHVLSQLFPGDLKSAQAYRKAVGSATNFMTQTAKMLFPGYKFTGEVNHSWRLTEMYEEELHVDSYGNLNDELVRVRLFYNPDDTPRIWRTTWNAAELLDRYWDKEKLYEVADQHPNKINAAINSRLNWRRVPAHNVHFAPGALWVCCSQLVSHEIFYGRRAWAYTFSVDPSSIRDPKSRYAERIREVVKARRANEKP